MKQLYKTLVLFFIFSSYAFAQDTAKTKLSKWAVGVQVNTIEKIPSFGGVGIADERYLSPSVENNKSYSFGLIGNYRLNENCSFRLQAGYTNRNIVEDYYPANPNNGNYTMSHATIRQTNTKFSPGIQWGMKQKKFVLYGGFDIPFTLYGTMAIKGHTDSYTNDTLSFIEDDVITIPRGISIGIGSFSGFLINVISHIAIGSEVSCAYLYSKTGNVTVFEGTSSLPGGTPQTTTYKIKDSIQRLGIFNIQGTLSIFYTF